MYIVGHCYAAELSGVFPHGLPSSSGIGPLMLPDYANCHDWGYEHYAELTGRNGALIRAHLVADWYVHFGRLDALPRTRRGWAYQRMRVASKFYESFYEQAHRAGLSDTSECNDSRRGFSHSMMEYAIDTAICRRGWFEPFFFGARTALVGMSRTDAQEQLLTSGVPGRFTDLGEELASYQERVALARKSEDLAFLAAARKFGLEVSHRAADFVARHIARILETVTDDEIESVCVASAETIRQSCTWPDREVSE